MDLRSTYSYFSFWVTPDDVQCLLLALLSGITPAVAQGTIWDARLATCKKNPTHCTITEADILDWQKKKDRKLEQETVTRAGSCLHTVDPDVPWHSLGAAKPCFQKFPSAEPGGSPEQFQRWYRN